MAAWSLGYWTPFRRLHRMKRRCELDRGSHSRAPSNAESAPSAAKSSGQTPPETLMRSGRMRGFSQQTIPIAQTGNGNVGASYQLPTDVTYTVASGIPTSAAAVPDGFGSGTSAIAQGVSGGVTNVIYAPFRNSTNVSGSNRGEEDVRKLLRPIYPNSLDQRSPQGHDWGRVLVGTSGC